MDLINLILTFFFSFLSLPPRSVCVMFQMTLPLQNFRQASFRHQHQLKFQKTSREEALPVVAIGWTRLTAVPCSSSILAAATPQRGDRMWSVAWNNPNPRAAGTSEKKQSRATDCDIFKTHLTWNIILRWNIRCIKGTFTWDKEALCVCGSL